MRSIDRYPAPRRTSSARALMAITCLALAGCGESAKEPSASGYGPHPVLPAPVKTLIPTIDIPPASGWPAGATPRAAPGFTVTALARGLDHPRWLAVLPNGDVLVAETNGPSHPKGGFSLRGFVVGWLMRKAGASVPSPDRITLLRRAPDGTVTRSAFLTGLHSPFGMSLFGDTFYVADTDALLAFPYKDGATSIMAAPRKIADLPGGPIDHHWTKDVIASRDGKTLYVTVGSNSNRAEKGMAVEENRADVLAIDAATGATRVFAAGLRNPNGLAWQPQSGALWVAVNERDEMGSDLVPDYMTSLKEGGFYGWPYSYWGDHLDPRVTPPRPDLVAKAIVPDYGLGAHTASLGLAFYEGAAFPAAYTGGAFVGQHGSWNRKPPSGYKVVFVPFKDGAPAGAPQDFLTGFLGPDGDAWGRPVGVRVAKDGALLVADDVGGTVWRVAPSPTAAR